MNRVRLQLTLAKIAIFFGCMVNLTLCYGHESRPISVDITETAQHIYAVKWRVPGSVALTQIPRLAFPRQCHMKNAPTRFIDTDAFVQHTQYLCPTGLMGARIKLVFPAGNPALSTLFRLRYLTGEQLSHILKPGELLWQIPEAASKQQVILDYTQLGVMHIGTGFDHLLFVACLLFIAKTRRRILLTISGFTLAHSLTLFLTTLDWLRLPAPAVEAVIALSIVFLATEIAKGQRNSWTFQYPIIVSSCFGLLHGFGFATVLTDIGLPQTELLLALLYFNVGIEIGQLCFVALVVLVVLSYWMLKRIVPLSKKSQLNTKIISVYLIGTVSCFWLLERLAAF